MSWNYMLKIYPEAMYWSYVVNYVLKKFSYMLNIRRELCLELANIQWTYVVKIYICWIHVLKKSKKYMYWVYIVKLYVEYTSWIYVLNIRRELCLDLEKYTVNLCREDTVKTLCSDTKTFLKHSICIIVRIGGLLSSLIRDVGVLVFRRVGRTVILTTHFLVSFEHRISILRQRIQEVDVSENNSFRPKTRHWIAANF